MAIPVDPDKKIKLMRMIKGTLFKATNGELFNFIELKRTRFTATRYPFNENESTYSVPINMFDHVVEDVRKEESSVVSNAVFTNDSESNESSDFERGELVYVVNPAGQYNVYEYEHYNPEQKRHHCKGLHFNEPVYLSKTSQMGTVADLLHERG